MALIYSTNTGTTKYGAQVANALDGARQFLPAFQHCPARSLASIGHPDFGITDRGLIAPIQSINEAGYCGGQKDANARIIVENCVSRPRYILKEGLVEDDDYSYCDGSPLSGQPADGTFSDTFTQGGLKSGATRYQGDAYTLPSNPILSSSAYQGAPDRTCPGRVAIAQASSAVVGQNPVIRDEMALVRNALTGTGGTNQYLIATALGTELGTSPANFRARSSAGPMSNENGLSQQTAAEAYRNSNLENVMARSVLRAPQYGF
jgi:hypothetical protein